jgi:hypothetical protein
MYKKKIKCSFFHLGASCMIAGKAIKSITTLFSVQNLPVQNSEVSVNKNKCHHTEIIVHADGNDNDTK